MSQALWNQFMRTTVAQGRLFAAGFVLSIGLGTITPVHAAGVKGRDWKTSLASARLTQPKTIHALRVVHPAPYYPPAKYLVNGPAVPAVVPSNVPEPAKTAAFLNALEARRSIDPARFDANHPGIGPMIGAQLQLQQMILSGKFDPTVLAQAEQVLLPNTPYYQYFEARRSIDPARFDTYHPDLSATIAQNQVLHNLIGSAENLVPFPAGGTSPLTVPEPGPLTLVAVAVSALLALRWMRGRFTRASLSNPA